EEMPLTRHPLEGLESAILEAETGAGDQVLHGAGDEDLAGPRGRGDARPDVDGEPGDLVARELDLAGVEPGANVKTERVDAVAHRARAADRAGGAVERGENPVARGVDLAAPEAAELAPEDRVVPLEEIPPAAIAQGRGLLGGADDVGEEDRGEDAVRLGAVPHPGQELLDLVEDRVGVLTPGHVVVSREFHELGSGDP